MFGLLAVIALAFGCKQPDVVETSTEPSLEVSVENIMQTSAELVVKSADITEICYVVTETEIGNVNAAVVFKNGTVQKVTGQDRFKISGLESEHDYLVYVAARVDASTPYEDVLVLEFTTVEYSFDKLVTVLEKDMDSFKVFIDVPETVGPGEDKHAIRYGVITLPFYLDLLASGGRPDAEALTDNGLMKVTESRELYYGPENVWVDKDLNPVPEEEADPLEHYYLHDYFSPGEPLVFLAGEFEWGEDAFGRGWDHFIPLFDYDTWYDTYIPPTTPLLEVAEMQDELWSGEFQREYITLDPPTVLDGGVTIEPVSSSPIDAEFNVIPDDDVYMYCVGIMDQGIYEDVIRFLGGNEDYLQWFLTGYYAWRFGLAQTYTGAQKIKLTNHAYILPNTTYHVLVTCMGDSAGSSQSFQRTTISTTPYMLPRPVVEVTAVDDKRYPDRVMFNIKAPNKDLSSGKWVCNFVREFEMMRNVGYTYPEILGMGVDFFPEEIQKINSDEGYDVWFTSPPAESWRMAVLGYNAELQTNTFERTDKSYADCTAKQLDAAAWVKTDLYDRLAGEWTAKATILSVYDENGQTEMVNDAYVSFVREIESKVTIGQTIYYPETIPDYIYDLYPPKVDENGNQTESDSNYRSRVQDIYNQFCSMADDFVKYNVDWQNRLLCTGYAVDKYSSGLATGTPWDLFTSTTYGSYDNAQIFYDFGPKWYIEFYKDAGEIKARLPINTETMRPFSNWDGSNTYYLLPYSAEKNTTIASFGYDEDYMPLTGYVPVEISSDASTITIKPLVSEGVSYYPTPQYFTYGAPSMAYAIISDVVLTKGWNGEETGSEPVPASYRPDMMDVDGNVVTHIETLPTPKSATPLKTPVKYEVSEQLPVTHEKFVQMRHEFYSNKK